MCVDARACVFPSTNTNVAPREANLRFSICVFARALAVSFVVAEGEAGPVVFQNFYAVLGVIFPPDPIVYEFLQTFITSDGIV